jgi:hypothetical protein
MLIKWTKTALASVDEIAGFIAENNPTRATVKSNLAPRLNCFANHATE